MFKLAYVALLGANAISLQSKMSTVASVFEGLKASKSTNATCEGPALTRA